MATGLGITAAARVLQKRLKDRKLPPVEVPQVESDELARTLRTIQEHFRMYEGESNAPKQRFVTIADLEQAGLIKADVKQGFSYIAQVLEKDVAQEAGSTANPTLKEPIKRDTSRTPRSAGGGGGGGTYNSAQNFASPATAQKLNDSQDVNANKPAKGEFFQFDGTAWKNFPMFNRENVWQRTQEFRQPLRFREVTTHPVAAEGIGFVWVLDEGAGVPNTLWFTDDEGTEHELPSAGVVSVAAGTTTDSTLRWDSANWVENLGLLSNATETTIAQTAQLTLEADATINRASLWTHTVAGVNTKFLTRGSSLDRLNFGNAAFELHLRGSKKVIQDNAGQAQLTFEDAAQTDRWRIGTSGAANDDFIFYDEDSASVVWDIDDTSLDIRFFQDMFVQTGSHLRVLDAANTSYVTFLHGGTNFSATGVGTTNFNISGFTGHLWVRDGAGVRISNTGDGDYNTMTHNGTDFINTYTNTTWQRFIGLGSGVLFQDGAELRIYETTDVNYVRIAHDSLTHGQIYNAGTNATTLDIGLAGDLIRFPSTTGLTLASTDHPFQIGVESGLNVRADRIGIQAVNNGAASTLELQRVGGDVFIGQDTAQPWLTLNSGSGGGNWTTQGAGISLGESSKKGSAALHLTYRGDGFGWIGMGTVFDTGETGLAGEPAFSNIKFDYNADDIVAKARFWIQSKTSDADLRVYDSTNVDYIRFHHDGTDAIATFNGTTDWNITNLTRMLIDADVSIDNGNTLRMISPDSQDYFDITRNATSVTLAALGTNNGAADFIFQATGSTRFRIRETVSAGETSSAVVEDHGLNSHDVGFNDLIPFNVNVSDTLEAQHAGQVALKTTTTARTLTLAASGDTDFPVGAMTTVINAFTSTDYTITEGSGTTLYYLDGSTRTDTAGGATVGPGGVANIWRRSTTEYYIWGTGISP